MSDPWEAFERLLTGLDRLGIRYAVGGSLASSVHGVPRATVDVDLVVDLPESKIEPLVEDLKAEFFAETDLIRDAVRSGRSFTLIHYKSAYKFDLFPLPDDPYYRTELDRRFEVNFLVTESQSRRFSVVTAEDAVLAKLVWYQAGGEVSTRQWNDLLGIVQMRRRELDREYLRRWALSLKVDRLLSHLLEETWPGGLQFDNPLEGVNRGLPSEETEALTEVNAQPGSSDLGSTGDGALAWLLSYPNCFAGCASCSADTPERSICRRF